MIFKVVSISPVGHTLFGLQITNYLEINFSPVAIYLINTTNNIFIIANKHVEYNYSVFSLAMYVISFM